MILILFFLFSHFLTLIVSSYVLFWFILQILFYLVIQFFCFMKIYSDLILKKKSL